MNTISLRSTATVLLFGAILAGCGAGRTLVMEPPSERRAFAGATVVNGEDSVTVPAELRGRLTQKVQEGLYGTSEKPGSFRNEPGLQIRMRVVQFEPGNQFQRWFWGGIGNISAGNQYRNSGGIYDTATSMWRSMTTPTETVLPGSKRWGMAAWSSGNTVFIWGGYTGTSTTTATGASYDLATASWTSLPSTNAPVARALATAVWTGTEAVVWGGQGSTGNRNDGKIYRP